MKNIFCTILVLICAHKLMAAEGINSPVIHNYTYVGVGYDYFHDVNDGDAAHGIFGQFSADMNDFLLFAGANHAWGDDSLRAWSVGGGVGYAVRLMRNQINIIPRVAVAYSEASIETGFGEASANATTLHPGVTVSYAINSRISVNAGYTYATEIDADFDVDGHGFSVGTRIALREWLGLNLGVFFDDDDGFNGASAGLSYHF